MYEGVHARPDGESTVARMALTARDYGFDGIVVRNHGDLPASYDPATIPEEYGVDVVTGVEVRADDVSRASGFVGSARDDQTVVAVHGGDAEINRFAVEQPAVDVLAHPMRGDGDVNHVLAQAAADNGVRVEFDLGPVLRGEGGERVQAIADLRKLREILTQYDVPFVVSANARSHLEVRAPRELQAVGEAIGFTEGEIEAGLEEWRVLAERNRERASDAFVEPGVRTVNDDGAAEDVSGGDDDGDDDR